MRRSLKWAAGSIGLLLVAAFVALSFLAGSPRGVYGMLRYALPHMHRGTLQVGSDAPDARLVGLDGASHFHIRERTGARPLCWCSGASLDRHFAARWATSFRFMKTTRVMLIF